MTSESATEAVPTKPFRILTVCTGNICRSPIAERLLQAELDERHPGQFVVQSAGTGALVGYPIDPQMEGLVRALGGNPDNFYARQLSPETLKEQDLVLTLTREHRGRVVEMAPAMLKKTFTLREFARIVSSIESDGLAHGANRWRAWIPKALRKRSAQKMHTEDDVIDPYKQDNHVFNVVAKQISHCVSTLVTFTD